MKTTINSFQGVVAAIAVAFVFVVSPLTASAFDFDIDFPDTLPDLTTEGLTLTKVECNIELNTYEVENGGSVTVTWETEGLDTIEINGETVTQTSGSYTIDDITESIEFELIATNDSGSSCTAAAYLTCLPPVSHLPECTLEAHPVWLEYGETTTLTWTSENGNRVTLSGTDLPEHAVGLNGSFTTDPLFDDAWYMVTVNDDDAVCKVDVYVHDREPEPPECPIDPKEGRVIVDFTGAWIFSDPGWSSFESDVEDVDLDAGTYNIRLVSWDGYIGRENGTQPREQYQLAFMNGDNEIVRSSAISDLEDGVTEALNNEVVDTNFTLSTDATGIKATHAFYPDSSSPNSLYPICAAIDYIPEEPLSCEDFGLNEIARYEIRNGALTKISEDSQYTTNVDISVDPFVWTATPGVDKVLTSEVMNNPVFTEHSGGTTGQVSTGTDILLMCDKEPELEVPSCDFFTANPTEIDLGQSTTLTWGTTNVAQVLINNGVGTVPVDGSIEVSPLEDTTYVLTAIGAKDTVVDCHVRVEVDTTPERPQCPFTPDANTTVFEFEERLRSDQSFGNSRTEIKTANLAAGKYDIQLASWDGYGSRDVVTQPNEQWQLEFQFDGNPIGVSNAISDLPDRVNAAFLQEQVNTKFELAQAANTVQGIHAVYPDMSSANSLNPICAAVTKVEDPAPSCDLFTATPSTITVGGAATLTWDTSNAVDVVINNGIGSVAASGTVAVSPLADTVYQLTVIGTDNRSVDCEVPVTVSEDPVPVCKVFTATPGNLPLGGGDVALNWEVEEATSVTISPTVGSVALIGSTTVNVTQSTTYTLTAVDANGDEVSCIAPVTVPDPVPFTCEGNVTFSATPNSVFSGSNVTLTWNVTDADSVSISEINATSFSGTQTVNPTSDTTYVLTATKDDMSIECPTTVTISTGGGGGSSSPRCELNISDERISLGEEITLTWDTTRANEVTLTDDLGNVIFATDDMLSTEKEDYFDGEITLTPTRDTEYTLLAERGSRDRTCRVKVDVEDDLVILETRDQQPLVAGISLTSVPHTGFEAGPFMTFMFYALLVAWAFYITYLIVARKRAAVAAEAEMPAVTTMRQAEEARPDVFVPSVTVQDAPAQTPTNLPTGEPTIGYQSESTVETDATITAIEDRAHAQKALLSSDAVRYFVATTEGSVERDTVLDEVIAEAKKAYPLEDGWIVINESRMVNLCDACAVQAAEAPQTFAEVHVVPEGSSSLAEAIVTGNVVAAYEMIGNRPMFSLADAAADLDAVYRKRHGEDKIVSTLLESETESLSDEQIKSMISALTSALDGTYTDEASAVKMAIMKAVKEVA